MHWRISGVYACSYTLTAVVSFESDDSSELSPSVSARLADSDKTHRHAPPALIVDPVALVQIHGHDAVALRLAHTDVHGLSANRLS